MWVQADNPEIGNRLTADIYFEEDFQRNKDIIQQTKIKVRTKNGVAVNFC